MKKTTIRALIADSLVKTEQTGVFLSAEESAVLEKYPDMESRDRAFYKKVMDGVCEYRIRIDYILDQFSKTPVNKMKPYIRAVLRMSVYQLIWMDNVPDRAICNEAVKLVSERGLSGLKGYVNGVLRNVSRGRDTITYPDSKEEPVRYLSVFYSCPEWITKLLCDTYGIRLAETILKASVSRKPVSVRLRSMQEGEACELEESWEKKGIHFEANPYLKEGRLLDAPGAVRDIPGYEEGMFVVQDTGSMLVARMGCKASLRRILDLCGAPGGKSIHAADIMRVNSPHVLCLDISPERCKKIEENIDRLGLSELVSAGVSDASVFHEEYEGSFDLVIADVPCSGLGVMGHKSDVKYRITPEDIESLVSLQRLIIDNAVRYVAPGGRLVYSTCTLTSQENTDQAAYIEDNYGFKDITEECARGVLPDEALNEDVMFAGHGLQIIPGVWRSDGFYIAVFEKQENDR